MLFHSPLASSSCPFMVKWKQSWVKKVISIFPFCTERHKIQFGAVLVMGCVAGETWLVSPSAKSYSCHTRDPDESLITAWCFTLIGLLKADTCVTGIGVREITGRRGGSACFRKGWRTTAKSSLKKRSLYSSSSSLFCTWKQREKQFIHQFPSKHTNYWENCEREISMKHFGCDEPRLHI